MLDPIYSIDIFDTLITRRVTRPTDIFFLVYDRARKRYKDENAVLSKFPEIRVSCERSSRKNRPSKETSLDEIYLEIEKKYGLSSELCEYLKKIEQEIEIDNCIPIHCRDTSEVFSKVSFDQAVLLTDMYLPRETINKMLIKCGIVVDDDRLIISHEIDASKARGDAFKVLKNRFPKIVHHFGDNLHSDVRMARLNGIQASAVASKVNVLSTLEDKHIEKRSIEEILLYRHIREVAFDLYEREKIDGSGVLALMYFTPVLLVSVLGIIQILQDREIHRIAFISRDGYYPFKIFKAFTHFLGIKNLDASYIFMSRASINAISKQFCETSLAEKGQSSERTIEGFLKTVGLYHHLESAAVFDVGWNGSVQRLFSYFKKQSQISECLFIAGIYMHRSVVFPKKQLEAFSLTEFFRDPIFKMTFESQRVLPEWFLRAPHGGTTGYHMQEGRCRPRLGEQSEGERSEIRSIGNGYLCITQQLLATFLSDGYEPVSFIKKIEGVALRNYVKFAVFPEPKHVSAFSHCAHNHDTSHSKYIGLVGNASLADLFLCRKSYLAEKTGWPNGVVALKVGGKLSKFVQSLLFIRECIVYLIKKNLWQVLRSK